MSKKSSSVERVKNALKGLQIAYQFMELPHSTRTAREAAEAVNSSVSQIVKSLVFRTEQGTPLLILTSGSNQVDADIVRKQVGDKIELSDPEFVHQQTGFAIGGVSPIGLKNKIPIYIDRDLLEHSQIWAAAGSSHAVFSIQPKDLVNATGGQVIDVHP